MTEPLLAQRIEDVYRLGRRLGKPGFYGYAREAVHKSTKERRAVKIIKKTKLRRAADVTMFTQEMEILRSLDCPYIIKGYEIFETNKDISLVMELCNTKLNIIMIRIIYI